MLLIGVKEAEGWLTSRWQLTYRVSWEQLLNAVYTVYDYYASPEILVAGEMKAIGDKEEILKLEEGKDIVLRGMSQILKAPIMIIFYNQVGAADVNVPMGTDEFDSANYQKFNMALCQYMDSLELAMYR